MSEREQRLAETLASKARGSGIPIPVDAPVKLGRIQFIPGGIMMCVELEWFDEETFETESVVGWQYANGVTTWGYPIDPEKMTLLS